MQGYKNQTPQEIYENLEEHQQNFIRCLRGLPLNCALIGFAPKTQKNTILAVGFEPIMNLFDNVLPPDGCQILIDLSKIDFKDN